MCIFCNQLKVVAITIHNAINLLQKHPNADSTKFIALCIVIVVTFNWLQNIHICATVFVHCDNHDFRCKKQCYLLPLKKMQLIDNYATYFLCCDIL